LQLIDEKFSDVGVKAMNNLKKDLTVGVMFIGGIGSFISGQFILSTVLFAIAAIYSNIFVRAKTDN
jgi:hypothetical protein